MVKNRGCKVGTTRGQGSQFLKIISRTQFMDEDAVASFYNIGNAVMSLRKIDDAFNSEDDINDPTEAHDAQFLKRKPECEDNL